MRAKVSVVAGIVLGLAAGCVVAEDAVPASVASKEPSVELTGRINYVSPTKDDAYSSGVAIEGQAVKWLSDMFGVGVTVGASQWDTQTRYIMDMTYETLVTATMGGEISFLSAGADVLVRLPSFRSLSVVLDGGVRYVIPSSDVEVSGMAVVPGYYGSYNGKVEFGNAVQGSIGARCEVELSSHAKQRLFLFVNGGYVFDIVESDVEFKAMGDSTDIGEADLTAWNLGAGLGVRF